jgi:hypothetical protein
MIRKVFLFIIILVFSLRAGLGQNIITASELFKRSEGNSRMGQLNIYQDQAIDTLISRYILANKNLSEQPGIDYIGMTGFRIQVYASNNRNAREESNKVNADFISKFPEMKSYSLYANPGYFKIRVGDFRTKTEATKLYLIISKEFPDAYIVPDYIKFPEQNTK